MRRLIVVAIVATLAIGGAAVAFASDNSERRIAAKPSASESNPMKRALTKAERRLAQASAAKIKCRTLGCINRSLTRLAKAVNVLVDETYNCEKYVNVTQYSGYLYDDGVNVFPTSGLDYTEAGDAATDRFLVYTC
jgi:hypothetical protein